MAQAVVHLPSKQAQSPEFKSQCWREKKRGRRLTKAEILPKEKKKKTQR
jgi:hypothetical protein